MVFGFLDFTRIDILSALGLSKYINSPLFELIDILIMSLAIGYIFSGLLKKPVPEDYDPLKSNDAKKMLWENVKFAVIVAAPAVVLHELAHKFIAMAFGAEAVLFAPYGWYLLIVLLKAINFPLLFFVGGLVVHTSLPPLQSAFVSLAGPLTNFFIWLILFFGLKNKLIPKKYRLIAIPLAKISLFLAIFNMIPIPGFDGFNFFTELFKFFF